MLDRLKATALGAISGISGIIGGVTRRGITFVADYLSRAAWLIDTTWHGLIKESYGKNAVVYACVRVLCLGVAEARLVAYTGEGDDKKEIDKTHELARLLQRPNELMTQYEALELTTIHVAAVGRSVWWKERANGGQTLALWPLRPDRVGPIYSRTGEDTQPGQRVLLGYAYQDPTSGGYFAIPRADTLAINFPDPDGESGGIVEGLGPLSVLSREVAADNKATEHVGALMANHAQPSVAIVVQDPVTEDEGKLIKAKFRVEFGGSKLGTPAVIDGTSDIKILGFSLKDLEFPGIRDNAEARICSALGVPAVLVGAHVGLKETSQRAPVKELREYFTETTIASYWKRYADQFTLELANEFGEEFYCEFDTSKVRALASQLVEKITPIKEAFTEGAATLAEYRAALSLPPLEPPEEGEVFYVPNTHTVTPASEKARAIHEARAKEAMEQQQKLIAAAPQPKQLPPGNRQPGPGQKPGEAGGKEQGQAAKSAIKAVDPREQAEYELQAALEALFAKLATDVAGRIRKGETIGDEELATAFGSVIEPHLVEAATAEGVRLAAEVGVQFDPLIVNQAAADWARGYNYELVRGLTETTRKTLQDAIAKYHETPGMTRAELEKLIEPAFGQARAEAISQTEITRSYSQAFSQYQAQLDAMGIRMQRIWQTSRDELTCIRCAPLQGKLEKEWKAQHPSGPPAHTRCRCSLTLRSVE